jgi:hypothetical protein
MAKLISVTVKAKKAGSSLAKTKIYSSAEIQGVNSGQIVNFIPCICKKGEGIEDQTKFDPAINTKIYIKAAKGEEVILWVTEAVSAVVAKDA